MHKVTVLPLDGDINPRFALFFELLFSFIIESEHLTLFFALLYQQICKEEPDEKILVSPKFNVKSLTYKTKTKKQINQEDLQQMGIINARKSFQVPLTQKGDIKMLCPYINTYQKYLQI